MCTIYKSEKCGAGNQQQPQIVVTNGTVQKKLELSTFLAVFTDQKRVQKEKNINNN
jgi:hypothetical protein